MSISEYTVVGGFGRPSAIVESLYQDSRSSPRQSGHLVLQSNPFTRKFTKTLAFNASGPRADRQNPTPASAALNQDIYTPPSYDGARLDNRALSSFRRNTKPGSAALGVTLATYRENRDMIVGRMNHIDRTFDSAYETLRRNKSALARLRRERQPLAGQVLEGYFGWGPLYEDAHAALTTVITKAIPPVFVSGRARSFPKDVKSSYFPYNFVINQWEAIAVHSINAKVNVENPNLHLADRAGLINLPGIAWDLVPWSFVVNMFTNTGHIINSLSDYVGLDIRDRSTTRTLRVLLSTSWGDREPILQQTVANQSMYIVRKDRIVGSHPSITFEFRTPKFSWDLAAIATSLVVQKIKKINRLMRII